MGNGRGFWTKERLDRLSNLAASGLYGSQIGADLGCSLHSVLTICGRENIPVRRYTHEEQAEFAKRAQARETRKTAKRREDREAARGLKTADINPGTSKTSPIYRNTLPKIPEMSKAALRAMLAEAVRNTAEARP